MIQVQREAGLRLHAGATRRQPARMRLRQPFAQESCQQGLIIEDEELVVARVQVLAFAHRGRLSLELILVPACCGAQPRPAGLCDFAHRSKFCICEFTSRRLIASRPVFSNGDSTKWGLVVLLFFSRLAMLEMSGRVYYFGPNPMHLRSISPDSNVCGISNRITVFVTAGYH